MKMINSFMVPESTPASEFVDEETIYYPSVQRVEMYDQYPFHLTDLDDDADPDLRTVFERGIAFKNADFAILTAKAMLGIDPYITAI
jgi:hypothetical protein